MTAEFAVALPAVLVCLAVCLGAMQVAVQQIRLSDAAAVAARMLGRGDDPASVVARSGASSYVSTEEDGLRCVRLSGTSSVAGIGALGVETTARACAIDDGREVEE
ncbi:TadE family type IV pilus minor pilin [Leifsonia sp. NPDC058230]|uniref:TadE family type IV pilus minor pilin n=1 Tax=Leifsonia sp. NPDC058230 TaxID=3346391 RepID=UPI0036DC734C